MRRFVVTGNIGRDVLLMLLLKEQLSVNMIMLAISIPRNPKKQILGRWIWRKELIEMLVKLADQILANMEAN